MKGEQQAHPTGTPRCEDVNASQSRPADNTLQDTLATLPQREPAANGSGDEQAEIRALDAPARLLIAGQIREGDRKSTRLNSSHH